MRRKRYLDNRQSDNHERWLVSYADFITLLFAFFVVMYAVSSVSEAKYRMLSDAIGTAFGAGDRAAAGSRSRADRPPGEGGGPDAQGAEREAKLKSIADGVAAALGPLLEASDARIVRDSRGVTIEINASALFAPGQAALEPRARPPLRAVAEALLHGDYRIQVEGHTDDTPIATSYFPSNWELSSARASGVVRLFADTGVDPRRLTAAGYAEYQPVVSNATADGRARNRRVTLTVLLQ